MGSFMYGMDCGMRFMCFQYKAFGDGWRWGGNLESEGFEYQGKVFNGSKIGIE